MSVEYRELSNNNLESRVVFFGKANCEPNHFFTGNNVRKEYVIHYILKGKGVFASANHAAVTLHAGDLFILPKNVPCFYKADEQEPWSYFWIGLSGIKIQTMLSGSILASKHYLRHVEDTHFLNCLEKLFDAVHHNNSLTDKLLIESLIYQIFYHLNLEFPAEKKREHNTSTQQLEKAVAFLNDNYGDHECTIKFMCQKLNLSRTYIYNLFKEGFSLSPQQYLVKMRMEEAKALIKNENSTIQQISNSVGYTDEFTFSKAFKRYTGFSPNIYRKNNNFQ